ncbi:MAG: nitroreductase/quinone reductase family protein [Chloroflexota bacterium]
MTPVQPEPPLTGTPFRDDHPPKVRKPPAALFRYLVNPIMSRLLQTRFGARRIGPRLMLIRFSGRKSGRRIEIPAGYQRDGADLLIFTHSPWWRNLRDDAPVHVLVEGAWHSATANASNAPSDVLPFFADLVRREGPAAAARYGLPLSRDREPSESEMRAGIQALGLALVRLRQSGT